MARFLTSLFLILTVFMTYSPQVVRAAGDDCSTRDGGVDVKFKLPTGSQLFPELTIGQSQPFSVVIKVKTDKLRTDAKYSAAVWNGKGSGANSFGSSSEIEASTATIEGDYSVIELPFSGGISRAAFEDYSTNNTFVLISYQRKDDWTMTDYCYGEQSKLGLRPQELADVGSCPIEFPDNIKYGEDTHGLVAELKPINDVKYALMIYPEDVTSQFSTSFERTQDFPVLRSVPGKNNIPNNQITLTQVDPGTNIDLNFLMIPETPRHKSGPLDIGKYTAVMFAYYNAFAVWKPGFACGLKVFEVTNNTTTPITPPAPGSAVKSADGKCYLLPDPLVSNQDLRIVATDMQTKDFSSTNNYRADLYKEGVLERKASQSFSQASIKSANNSFVYPLGRPGAGSYKVDLFKDDPTNGLICTIDNFSIVQKDEAMPNLNAKNNLKECPVACGENMVCDRYKGACVGKSSSSGEKCDYQGKQGIKTAIGCVPTDPSMLIAGTIRYISGFAGGIALLMMVFGSLRMLTSAGNADSLKNGREQFVSAIVGLLFVLFSVLLLQIIGVDILGLPGWTSGR